MSSMPTVWPLVGRDRDLAGVRAALADASVRGVLVVGKQGVGKTRLVETVLAERLAAGGAVERVISTIEGRDFPLAALAPMVVRSDADPELAGDPVRLLAHLQQALARAPADPVPLMFVDDLPLLDPLSAVLVSQLMEHRTVVLLATVRAGDPLPQMYNRRWSADGVVKVVLPPLTPDDCARLLRLSLGAPVATKSVGRLHSMSGGIPLHLRELVLSVVADGSLRQVEGLWQLAPGVMRNPVLAHVLATRIGDLEPAVAEVLRRVAVCQPMLVDDLPADAADAVMTLEQSCLVDVDQAADQWRIRLAHPAYADLIRAQMSRLHIRKLLLEQIEAVCALGRGPADVMRLTMWRLEATGRADPSVLLTAARVARQGHEFESVRRLARAAVDSEEQPSAEALLLWGEALRELGDRDQAGVVLDRAAAAGGPPEIRARVAVTLAGLACHGRSRPDLAVRILAQARADIPEESDAMALAGAVMLVVDEQTDRALEELALVDPRRLRTSRLAGLGFLATVGTLVSAGRPQQALDLADELLPLLRTTGNLFHDGMPLMMRAAALLELHGPELAIPEATAAMRECLCSGVDRLICYAASQLVTTALAAGRPRSAARWAREVISVARSAQHDRFVAVGMSGLACALAVCGDAAGARAALRALDVEQGGLGRADRAPPTWRVQAEAWTLAAEGRLSRATDLLDSAAAAARSRGQWSVAGSLLHDAVRISDAKAAVRIAVAGLREVTEHCPSPLAARQYRHASAMLNADVNALATVSQEWEAAGNLVLAAETAFTAARIARAQRSARLATALTARGSALAAACQGARTPQLRHEDAVDPLSPREREIAALASQGLQSKEIADSLVVSIRTVDNHLQAVYSKLGIAGRRELAGALRPR